MSDLNIRAAKAVARQTRAASAAERKTRLERIAYTVDEVAEALARDPATLHRWIAQGLIRAIRIGGSTMIARAELDRVMAEGAPTRRRRARAAGGRFAKATEA